MKETGRILKESREKSGLTIHEVSLALKINPRIIKAIEEGDQSQLPPRTFLRGFVQSYANFLKLDLESFMVTFNGEMGTPKPSPTQTPENKMESTAEKPSSAPQQTAETQNINRVFAWLSTSNKASKILVGILAVAILIIIVVVKRTIDKYQQESQVFAPPDNVQSLQLKNTPPIPTVPLETPKTSESTPPQTSPGATSPTPTPIESTKSAKPEPPPATPAPSKPTVTKKEAPPAEPAKGEAAKAPEKKETKKPETKTSETKAASTKPASQEVIIEALDKVSAEVQIDDGPAQTFNLNSDQIRTIKAKRSIKLKLSDGGAVNIIHNGKDKGVPGDLGQPLTLSYPK